MLFTINISDRGVIFRIYILKTLKYQWEKYTQPNRKMNKRLEQPLHKKRI